MEVSKRYLKPGDLLAEGMMAVAKNNGNYMLALVVRELKAGEAADETLPDQPSGYLERLKQLGSSMLEGFRR